MLVTLKCHNEILMHSIQIWVEPFATWKVYLIRRCFSSPGAGSQTPGRQLFWPSHSTRRLSSTWIEQANVAKRSQWLCNWVPHTGKAEEQKYIQAQGVEQQEAPNQTNSRKRRIAMQVYRSVYFSGGQWCNVRTKNRLMVAVDSNKGPNLKVVKWCWKGWNGPILMHIYDKQCEIIQKNQWKNSNFQIQCFCKGTSGALCWKLRKTQKLGKLKHPLLNFFKW